MMSLLRSIAGEVTGMFAGDLRLAAGILALVAATVALVTTAPHDRLVAGGMLLAGSLAWLIHCVRRAAAPARR